jgi:hypothetical protein
VPHEQALQLTRRDPNADFAVMSLTATMASPLAWEHHYGVSLPLFALLAPMAVRARNPSSAPWLLALAFVLIGQYLQAAQRLAYTVWNPCCPTRFSAGCY